MTSYEIKSMPVSHEIKSQLAKLLATEDLVVEHKQVQTACFNVHTRVLTLPLWEKASNIVYDLLVGHEVGHALFTPDEDWTETVKIPPQFVNVVEDARIEKLMKRRYMGLAKTFFNGYKELNEDDFFQLEDEDTSKFNLADKANLYFKIGNFINLTFTSEEKEIIDIISSAETFQDTLVAAEKLYNYCKQEKVEDTELNSILDQIDSKNFTPSNEEKSEEFSEESSDSENSFRDQIEKNSSTNQSQTNSQKNENELEVRTVESFEDNIKSLVNNSGFENTYIEVPELNLSTVIANNHEIHDEIDSYFNEQQKEYDLYAISRKENPVNIFKQPDYEYKKFKQSSQKEVNYLVKEFECRKAADQYSRASVSRTGILDTSRLHSYKYSEDLFKKVTVIPDGKNHGLIFVLDWSGSMQDVIVDTCKQLFNLIWFCKKVSIPFEVYAFTNEWRRPVYNHETKKYSPADFTSHYVKKDGLLSVQESFTMMNILTSKISGSKLEHQMTNIWRLAYAFEKAYHCSYNYPVRLSLSGTPLNEAIISLHQILPKFQKENKLQKVQCIILTDGEASYIPHHVEVKRKWSEEPHIGTRHINPETTFLRDRKIGTNYKIGSGYHKFTDTLLKNLKDKFPFTNFIGIRVLESRNASKFINLYYEYSDEEYEKIQNDWKKLKSFIITKSGYDAYFGISATTLSQDAEFDVHEDATKSQIKSAFVKSLKTKKLNKKVLGEFISLVI